MSATDSFENSILLHIFQNANIANIGDATGIRGSVAAGSLFVSLHSSDPGEAGNQSTNEVAYTGYARVAVARSAAGWAVSGSTASNVAAITFGLCTAGSVTATNAGIGAQTSGANQLLFKAAMSPTIAIAAGVTPILQAGTGFTTACD
jgi:hypothetical protein